MYMLELNLYSTLETLRICSVRDFCELRLSMRTLSVSSGVFSKDPILVAGRHLVLRWQFSVEALELVNSQTACL